MDKPRIVGSLGLLEPRVVQPRKHSYPRDISHAEKSYTKKVALFGGAGGHLGFFRERSKNYCVITLGFVQVEPLKKGRFAPSRLSFQEL